MLTDSHVDLLGRIYDKPLDVLCAHSHTTAALVVRGLADVRGKYILITNAGKALHKHIGEIQAAEPWKQYFPRYCKMRRALR